MQRLIFHSLVMVMIALFTSACTGPMKVDSYSAPGTGIGGGWACYAWDPSEPTNIQDPKSDQMVRQLIDERMQAKGYIKAQHTSPDLYLRIRVGRYTEQAETGHESWQEGALAIEALDTMNNALVWRGRAEARIDESDDPQQRRKRIDTAVTRILEKFPSRRGR